MPLFFTLPHSFQHLFFHFLSGVHGINTAVKLSHWEYLFEAIFFSIRDTKPTGQQDCGGIL
jgi:hypothetical protein